MTLWLNHTIDERIAMLQRAEEKFRINQVAVYIASINSYSLILRLYRVIFLQ